MPIGASEYEQLRQLDTVIDDRLKDQILEDIQEDVGYSGAICCLYMAFLQKEYQGSESDTIPSKIIRNPNIPESVREALQRTLPDEANRHIQECVKRYSQDELRAFILFMKPHDSKGNPAYTPSSIVELAVNLLNFKEGDTFGDLCSGTGSFMVDAFPHLLSVSCTGIELNYLQSDISILRTSLLQFSHQIECENVLGLPDETLFDKVFIDPPLLSRRQGLKGYDAALAKVCSELNISTRHRMSPNALYLASAWRVTAYEGRCVAITTEATLFNESDRYLRHNLIDRGCIEAVVALPAGLIPGTQISPQIVVLSTGNEYTRLVDASDLGTKENPNRRVTTLSETDIHEILHRLSHDGMMSKAIRCQDLCNTPNCELVTRRHIGHKEIPNARPLESVIKSIKRGAQTGRKTIQELANPAVTGYKYFNVRDIEDGLIDAEDLENGLSELPERLEPYVVADGNIVISRNGIGGFKTAIVKTDGVTDLVALDNVYIIEVDPEKLNPYYLLAYLQSPDGVDALNTIGTGAAIQMIRLRDLRNMQVPVPPLPEQKAIADAQRVNTEKCADLKHQLRAARAALGSHWSSASC